MYGGAPTLRGRLLVATPVLLDPNFVRTVILIADHDDNGAVGLVLNRPAELLVADGLPGWEQLAAVPDVVFFGGPVGEGAAFCVGLTEAPEQEWPRITGRVHLLDPGADPAELAGRVASARVFAGYAGWSAEQLEEEIAEGAWYVVDAVEEDLFTDPTDLWNRVLRRQGGSLALVATHPLDPTLN